MNPKPKANNIITAVLSAILTVAFLWFFLSTPLPSSQSHAFHRSFQPARRNSEGIIARFDLRNITASSHALQSRERILILTPIARWYDEYWTNLIRLSYPHELIDLGFILPKGKDGDQVLEKLVVRLKEVQGKHAEGHFNHVTILRQDVEIPTSQDEKGLENLVFACD